MKESYLEDFTMFVILSWVTPIKDLPDLETLIDAVDEYFVGRELEEDKILIEYWLNKDYFS